MNDMADQAGQDKSFGDALFELDGIVTRLEGGQLDLEESMEEYERGVALLKSLQGRLADAQQKVTMLIGELEEEAPEVVAPSPGAIAASDAAVQQVTL